MLKRSVMLGVIGSFAAGAALAQGEAVEDGIYIRAGAGVSFVNGLDQELSYNPNASPLIVLPAGRTVESETGYLATAAIGFDYADGIRTELEYRYASSAIGTVTPSGDPNVFPPFESNEDVNAHFVFSNFYFDLHNDGPVTPFIGGGVGGIFAAVLGGERDAALAYQGRAGLSLELGDSFLIDAEYVYTRSNTLRYGADPEDFTPGGPLGPAVDGDNYQSSSVMVSLRKHF